MVAPVGGFCSVIIFIAPANKGFSKRLDTLRVTRYYVYIN